MIQLHVPDMSCQHCVAAISEALKALNGVSAVTINLEQKRVTVEGEADRALIEQCIKDAGYTPDEWT